MSGRSSLGSSGIDYFLIPKLFAVGVEKAWQEASPHTDEAPKGPEDGVSVGRFQQLPADDTKEHLLL